MGYKMKKISVSFSDSEWEGVVELHWQWFKERAEKTSFRISLNHAREGRKTRDISRKEYIMHEMRLKDEDDLRKIVCASFDEMKKIKKKYRRLVKSQKPDNLQQNPSVAEKKKYAYQMKKYERGEKLKIAFGYDDFITPSDGNWYEDFVRNNREWNSKIYCEFLKIDVCPYCERQYIFRYETKGNRRTTAEMDHFFAKSKYPFLSCTLLNLIPSCHVCNYGKLNYDREITYPYSEGFGDGVRFRAFFSGDSINLEKPVDSKNVKIKIRKVTMFSADGRDKIFLNRVKESVKVFNLENLYNCHVIELKDLFIRYRNYCYLKRKEIARLVYCDGCDDAVLALHAREMKKILLGLPVVNENAEYPLKKFKEDIIKQLDE